MTDIEDRIHALIASRKAQLTEDTGARTVLAAREVYKEEKKERSNYSSRDVSDINEDQFELASDDAELCTSSLTRNNSSLTAQPSLRSSCAVSHIASLSDSEESGIPEDIMGEDVKVSGAASICSRALVGISAQHNITNAGVKVTLSIQTKLDAAECTYVGLTAELKRSNRLRELKPNLHDEESFAALYAKTLEDLKELESDDRKKFCIGRVHTKGQRSAWFADIFVLGVMDEQDRLAKVYMNYKGEEYEIVMDGTLSPTQTKHYHSCGIYGQLIMKKNAPTLDSAPRLKF
jgi:hypothetical protein